MADPIITAHFRTQAVFQGKSGLPEDRFVNNWAWWNRDLDASVDDFVAAITRVLDAFYFGVGPNATTIAGNMLTDRIIGVEYRTYDLGQAPPRTPHIHAPVIDPQPAFSTGEQLPEEVAVVLSLRTQEYGATGGFEQAIATQTGTRLSPRSQRGRMYIGPLVNSCLHQQVNGPVVSAWVQTLLADRANNVLNTSESPRWCVISPKTGTATLVTGGYTDGAFDTQRRRGLEATTRVAFGDYLVTT